MSFFVVKLGKKDFLLERYKGGKGENDCKMVFNFFDSNEIKVQ